MVTGDDKSFHASDSATLSNGSSDVSVPVPVSVPPGIFVLDVVVVILTPADPSPLIAFAIIGLGDAACLQDTHRQLD